MSKNEKVTFVVSLIAALFVIISALGWLLMDRENKQAREIRPTDNRQTLDAEMNIVEMAASQTAAANDPGMNLVEAAASQTAAAELTPSATMLPGLKYWSPVTGNNFAPYFIYDSTHWALTDLHTLASLQVTGCTLRLAGGRALGPGWATEESFLQVGDIVFIMILAKHNGAPQFVTYSAPDGTVFEIDAVSDFAQCQLDGETILKTMNVQP